MFKSCPEKFRNRYVDEISPLGYGGSRSQNFGTRVHDALELFHNEPPVDTEWGPGHPVYDWIIRSYKGVELYLKNREFKDFCQLMGIMKAYCARYPDGSNEWEPVCLEEEFAVPLLGPDGESIYTPDGRQYYKSGKVDGLVRFTDGPWKGEYALLEHKTAARADYTYFERIWMDRQTHQYALYLARQMGIEIRFIVYNVLGK